jgi:hypothetical protein
MAITVKHSKVSTIPDGTDTSVVRPSDWNDDHVLTGTIPVANGGTGASTANGGFNALAPSQTGNSGKYLTTDGTDTSWATNPLGTVTSVAATAGTGISVTGSPITTSGTLNITNTAPDQTVVLTAGTGISTTGTYPNFTITNTSPSSGGTVTSVSGTTPVNVATGTTTPVISLAASYGDTQNPYASKTANYVLASPDGSAGVPTFRALTATDIPSLTATYIPYTGATTAVDLNTKSLVNVSNLGINTTTVPTIKIRAIGDNNSSSRIAMRGYSSDANSSAIRVTKFRGTTSAPQAPQSGDSLGKFELAGYGTTSSEGYPQASLEGLATEAWGATARGTKAVIKVTSNTTTTQAIALTIDQDKSATFASTVTATTFSGSGANLTSIPNSALVNSAITINGTSTSLGGSISVGTVTSVTGTSPVVSSGGATPAISMPAATTSVSGYLTSTDWNTFNGKGSGSVTSVSGTGSVNGITLTGTVTSSGNLTLGGTLGSIANSQLTNSAITVNGTAISLGASGTITATATNALTIGSYLTGTSYNGSVAVTIAADATSANTASKLVARDASGNFSAGVITATSYVGVSGGTF